MKYLTNDKLLIVGAGGMIGSNMESLAHRLEALRETTPLPLRT